ncbi:MAG: endolytic transglycosylase MltG [Alphaproteobacteria bacterium]|nr:endolytic transglycosylase MltG [Alphaproteobacteria bacterium]
MVLVVGGISWGAYEFKKPGPLTEVQVFEIPAGTGLSAVSDNLQTAGIIEHPKIFMVGVVLHGKSGQIKAGEYEITPGMSPQDIMDKLVKGDIIRRQVTVREGLTSHEVVELLKTVEDLSGDVASVPPEGRLLPETYTYSKNEPRSEVIAEMKADMDKALLELCPTQPCWPEPLKSLDDVLTLASIVEKETGVPEERKRVAGVFLNRLRKGIPLQTDPTVIYAITKGQHKNDGKGPLGRRLLSKDLSFDSPYNTYKYAGLPPGPIANPGKASIEAVLHPEEHDLIYFVADGSGGHIFAKTLAEHNKNVAEWRKIRRKKSQ